MIFRAMVTGNDQKVRLATHMLAEEAEYWWTNAKGSTSRSGASHSGAAVSYDDGDKV